MKNKKIISRVLALFAVLVLMVSMALPAFADDAEQSLSNAELWESFVQYADYSGNYAYSQLVEEGFNDHDIYGIDSIYLVSLYPFTIGEFYQYDVFSQLLNPDLQSYGETYFWYVDGVLTLTAGGSTEPDLVYNIERIYFSYQSRSYVTVGGYDSNGNMVLYINYLFDDGCYIFNEIELGDGNYNYMSSDGYTSDQIDIAFMVEQSLVTQSDDFYRALTDDAYIVFHPAAFADGRTYSYSTNRPDGIVPPARTGVFGQLYYILYDAIYGSDAVIGTAQDFVLTQIATWMTYIVILLPVLVIAIFLWRVFAR